VIENRTHKADFWSSADPNKVPRFSTIVAHKAPISRINFNHRNIRGGLCFYLLLLLSVDHLRNCLVDLPRTLRSHCGPPLLLQQWYWRANKRVAIAALRPLVLLPHTSALLHRAPPSARSSRWSVCLPDLSTALCHC
jgi:hypothetical protein